MSALAEAREQTRARYPDADGYVERDGVRVFWEAYGDAPTTFLLFPPSPISHSRLWKAQIPYLSRHFRVVVFDPRGNGLSDRPTESRGLLLVGVRGRRPRGARGERGERRLSSVAFATAAAGRSCLPRPTPPPSLGVAAIAPFVPASDARASELHAVTRPTCPSTPTRAGRSATSTTGAATTATSSSSSSRSSSPSRTRRSRSRTASAGGSRAARSRSSSPTRRRHRPGRPRRKREDICRRVRCPVLVDPRRSRQLPDARACGRGGRADGRDARQPRGRGPPAAGAPPGQGQRPAEGLRRRGRAAGAEGEDVDAGTQPQAARALRLVADRARPRPARRRDRTGAAEAPPRPRDRLAGAAPGHGRARGRGGADPPGERPARERVGAHRERVGRARPARLPGDQADGRDPRRQLHALPRRRARGELRPLDRRRGLGGRLLPAREPGAEVGRVRVADRLRRLAADGGRRRARGVPDDRLQRRDDRAHRALPQDPRPGRVRRQPRRRRPQLVRERPSGDPRLDRAALRLLPAT